MSGHDKMHLISDKWGRVRNIDVCAEAEPAETWPYMIWINPPTQQIKVRNKADTDWIAVSGGAGAPIDAQYLVLQLHGTLTSERRFVDGDGLVATDGGAGGDYTLDVDSTVVRTSGNQSIAGIKTLSDNLVLDDGAGDSPALQFVGGSHDDLAKIYLDDAKDAGMSGLIARLAGNTVGGSRFAIQDSNDTTVWYVSDIGDMVANGTVFASVGSFGRVDGNPIAAQISVRDDVTNGVSEILRLYHYLEDVETAADGFGGRVLFRLENDGGDVEDAAFLDWVFSDVSDGSEDSYVALGVRVGGAALAETLRVDGAGLLMATGKIISGEGGVAVYNSADITIATATWTVLTFNAERWDDAAFHSVVSDTSRLTVPTGYDGWYVISGHVMWESSVAGTRRLMNIRVNASTIAEQETSEGTDRRMSLSAVYYLSAGDYVELLVYQNSGGDLDIVAVGNFSPEFRMVRVI